MRSRGFNAFLIFALLSVYVLGYGVSRWRKLLVRHEFHIMGIKSGPLATEIRPGRDRRTSGIGSFKNLIAEPLANLYLPLRWLEASIRTSTKETDKPE